ncbi:hypothetical protein ACWED2_10070 [Amycolatopsis sp. NPDC005003]
MKGAVRALIVVAVIAGLAGVAWMFTGRVASDAAIGNAQVLGALAGVAALLVSLLALWRRGSRRAAADPVPSEPTQLAVEYLATETLRYWRRQAHDRRITTPSSASVRWTWAGQDVAVPAAELQSDIPAVSGPVVLGGSTGRVLTSGVVTELRQQLYERLDDTGRIVVLGGPGAGKTAAMLLLLLDILEHRPPSSGAPVPVWLTLGGWNPETTSLEDWASAALTRDYPGLSAAAYGGPGTAKNLIRTGRIALFLDGLDEMAPAIQGPALQTIDRDATGLKVVLTSRTTEYQAALADGRLYRAAVIKLLPADIHDATRFLLAEQLGERRRAWQHVADRLREHPDSVAARTLTTPLALSLARDTYTRADPAGLLDSRAYPHPDALLHHLLAGALTLAYPNPTERAHATRWLSWIAQHMGTSRDLRWWDIPAWVPPWQLRLASGLGGGLLFGLTGGVVLGLVGGLLGALMGFGYGVAYGFSEFAGLAGGPRGLAMRWPARADLRDVYVCMLRYGLRFGPKVALLFGLLFGLTFGLEGGVVFGLAGGIAGGLVGELGGTMFGLAFGLAEGLFYLWVTPLATAHAIDPAEVYRFDRRRTLLFGFVVGLVGGLTGLVVGSGGNGVIDLTEFVIGLTGLTGLVVGSPDSLAVGLAGGLVIGFLVAFGPALQLTVVQTIWRLRGRPIRFLPLLQAALHRQVLRQAGAVYQFRHAALQDFLTTVRQPN